MNIFENALSAEIKNLNIEHDIFWDELLFEQEYKSISGDAKVSKPASEYQGSFPTIPSVDYKHTKEEKTTSSQQLRSNDEVPLRDVKVPIHQ